MYIKQFYAAGILLSVLVNILIADSVAMQKKKAVFRALDLPDCDEPKTEDAYEFFHKMLLLVRSRDDSPDKLNTVILAAESIKLQQVAGREILTFLS